MPGGLLFALEWPSVDGRRSMQYAGCGAISLTMVRATGQNGALTPRLVARLRATLLVRYAFPASTGEPVHPGAERSGAGTPPTRPTRLHQQAAQLAWARLGDVTAMAPFGRTIFARHQPERRTDMARAAKSADVIDKRSERERHDQANPRHRLQTFDHRIGRRRGRQPPIDRGDLGRQGLDQASQRRERRRQG